MEIDLPLLSVEASEDAVCLTSAFEIPEKLGLLPDLRVRELLRGHWTHIVCPEEVPKLLQDFSPSQSWMGNPLMTTRGGVAGGAARLDCYRKQERTGRICGYF